MSAPIEDVASLSDDDIAALQAEQSAMREADDAEAWACMTLAERREAMGGAHGGDGADD